LKDSYCIEQGDNIVDKHVKKYNMDVVLQTKFENKKGNLMIDYEL